METLNALLETAPALFGDTVVITSVNDGRHAKGSAHYSNDGWDVRTHKSGGKHRLGSILDPAVDDVSRTWVNAMRRKLQDGNYFVEYEQTKQHIHIQRAQVLN